jgi:site-specific DNA-methyltransferase (adenine-specific)
VAKKRTRTSVSAWPGMLDSVLEGDAMKHFKDVPDASARLVFVDPPFNIGYEYDEHDDAMPPADYLAWCARWISACVRVMAPDGHLWIASADEYVAELKALAEGRFGIATGFAGGRPTGLMRCGPKLHLRHWVCWFYTFGVNTPKKMTRSHTHILHFTKHPSKHVWNPGAIKVPSARQEVYRDKRAKPGGRLPDDTWVLRPTTADFPSVEHPLWPVPRICGTHAQKRSTPNQMPERVLGRIILASTNPGDLVLDPMCGSGTCPSVAKKLGRRFVGFELSPDYCLQAKFRVDAAQQGDALDGTGPLDVVSTKE